MENRYGDAEANFPAGSPGFHPGYLAYVEMIGRRRELPSSLILAAGGQAVPRIVRACGAVLGPVYHLADPDHAAIHVAVARLEADGPVLAVTAHRIFLTTAGGHGNCPLCAVFGPAGVAGSRVGACPVLAGRSPAPAGLLTAGVLAALHVLIDAVCDKTVEASLHMARGYSIDLQASQPARPRSVWGFLEQAGISMHHSHAE